MRKRIVIALLILLLSGSCTSQNVPPQAAGQARPATSAMDAATPSMPTDTPQTATHTAPAPPTRTASTQTEPASTLSANTTIPQVTRMPLPGAIVIDHNAIALFEQIPDEALKAASQIRLLFRHASVGKNITDGLDCLMNNFPKRPFFCDKGIPADQVVFDAKYDRTNWVFELHRPRPNINPPWNDKLNLFIQRVDALQPGDFSVVGYKHGYVEATSGSKIDDLFFKNNPADKLPSVDDLEALEVRHPELTVLYWTMGLPRASMPDSQRFNQQMRQYALEHGKIFVDLADVESHAPDGTPCVDSEGTNVEAICDDYTDEAVSGHLNALGSLRMSKAVWILMAQLAGWKP